MIIIAAPRTSYIVAAVLSFDAAALLYIVTEELLTSSHQTRNAQWTTAIFFLGFLAIMLLAILRS